MEVVRERFSTLKAIHFQQANNLNLKTLDKQEKRANTSWKELEGLSQHA